MLVLFLAFSCSAALGDDVRVRPDESRGRTWVLRADAVYLYENGTGAPARRFALPGWIYATPRFACEPDLLVESGGAVIVTSNIVPSLWRIDPEASSTVQVTLELRPEASKDFGFTSLRFAEHGTLLARGAIDRSRWQIDLASRSAVKVGEGAADCE